MPPDPWFTYPTRRTREIDLRLFCFPYAGGASCMFRKWREQLPATIEVAPVELPGQWSQSINYSF